MASHNSKQRALMVARALARAKKVDVWVWSRRPPDATHKFAYRDWQWTVRATPPPGNEWRFEVLIDHLREIQRHEST